VLLFDLVAKLLQTGEQRGAAPREDDGWLLLHIHHVLHVYTCNPIFHGGRMCVLVCVCAWVSENLRIV